jgi:hypothetical protein
MNDTGLSYYCQVAPPLYTWQIISQTSDRNLAQLQPGNVANVTLTAKNTGNTTWTNSGPNPVRLGTWPQERQSSFYTSGNWISLSRTVNMTQASVAPGANATFSFRLTASQAGTFIERFNLLSEGKCWMNDTGLSYFCQVTPNYSWQIISQTSDIPLSTLKPGDVANVTLTARNSGQAVWTNSGPNPIRLGTWPQERSSSFYTPGNWLGLSRPTNMIQASVAPGQNATFNFQMRAPSCAGGTFYERFNLVAEGITWMNYTDLSYYARILPSIGVVGNVGCQARDINGILLGSAGPGQIVTISYNGGIYYLKTPTDSRISVLPISISPTGGNLILAWYADIGWSGANYNEFRGNIRVQYSGASNRLWAVNDLPVESYLKGMCEVSPSGHMEYLKSMEIIARSYAEWYRFMGGRHPGEPFDLKNSRQGNGNDQVYAGYGYEYRVPGWPNSTPIQAINSTSGQVVNYPGYAVVITPYSHGAYGWTRAGSYPWLESVYDPYGDPNASYQNPPCNHLMGLSASGALGFAQRGSYGNAILQYYYRGTSLGAIADPGIRIAIYGLQL